VTKHLHLNAFLMTTGHHEASWRLPESNPRANTELQHYVNLARLAERGTFDSLFLADSPALFGPVGRRPSGVIEPLTLLTALATATENIGLIATASTSYNSPYNLARRFASLDHVSGGRAGWNVVTTATLEAARNFGLDELPAHADRYARGGLVPQRCRGRLQHHARGAAVRAGAVRRPRGPDPAPPRLVPHVVRRRDPA
jgi:alkanesulfonate monooxygenase SsuD/methylene tetrahydromethanopterin reductase-like flavin-dependent oxidoreductase (luciferase family)